MADRRPDPRLDDPAWLRGQYRSRSIADLAVELGCAPKTVRGRLVAAGVALRDKSERAAIARRAELNDLDWLSDQ